MFRALNIFLYFIRARGIATQVHRPWTSRARAYLPDRALIDFDFNQTPTAFPPYENGR